LRVVNGGLSEEYGTNTLSSNTGDFQNTRDVFPDTLRIRRFRENTLSALCHTIDWVVNPVGTLTLYDVDPSLVKNPLCAT
jgi:hypothetical protein